MLTMEAGDENVGFITLRSPQLCVFLLNSRPVWVSRGPCLLSRSSHSGLFASSNILTCERVPVHPRPLHGALNCHSRSAVLPQPLKAVPPPAQSPLPSTGKGRCGCLLPFLLHRSWHTQLDLTLHLSIFRLILLSLSPLCLAELSTPPRTAPSPCRQGPAAEDPASEAQKNEAAA